MAELVGNRTYTSKTIDNGDGTYTLNAHPGHIHYKDTVGDFQDVDYTIEDKTTYWQMKKASYKLYVNKWFDDGDLIRFDNKYEGCNHSIYYTPKGLRWINNPDMSDMSVWRTKQHVQGVVTGNEIKYTDAYGSGIHFVITLQSSGFRKEIVIDNLTDLDNPPTPDHRLSAFFKYSGSGLKILKKDIGAIDWDENGFYVSQEGFNVEESINRAYKSIIRPAYIKGSGALKINRTKKSLKVAWVKQNGDLFQIKVFPAKSWFLDATFPVKADTVTSFYPGAGDGDLLNDGAVWSTVQGAASGNGNDYADTDVDGAVGGGWGSFWIARNYLPFDTSALGASATISAAKLRLYFHYADQTGTNGNSWLTVVQSDSVSTTSTIANGDYDLIGDSIDNPTEGVSSRQSISGITTGQYTDFTLDATGRGWISKTSWTKLGVRQGDDCTDDSFLPDQAEDGWKFYTSERSGTTEDPILEVTYTVPDSSSSSDVSSSSSSTVSSSSSSSLGVTSSSSTVSSSSSSTQSSESSSSRSSESSSSWDPPDECVQIVCIKATTRPHYEVGDIIEVFYGPPLSGKGYELYDIYYVKDLTFAEVTTILDAKKIQWKNDSTNANDDDNIQGYVNGQWVKINREPKLSMAGMTSDAIDKCCGKIECTNQEKKDSLTSCVCSSYDCVGSSSESSSSVNSSSSSSSTLNSSSSSLNSKSSSSTFSSSSST